MKDKGLVTFFDVKRCGLYRLKKGGSKGLPAEKGDLREVTEKIVEWVKGRDFEQTVPWDVKQSPHRQKYYCKSVALDDVTGDTVFVFWKQLSDESGGLSGIVADSKCGSSSVDAVRVDANNGGQKLIIGQPLYYWFIPEYNALASIKFSHSLSDTISVCSLMKNYIDQRVKFGNKVYSDHEHENTHTGKIVKYTKVGYKSDDGKYNLAFHFEASTQKITSDDIDVDALADKISHIVIRDTISSKVKDSRASHFRIWDLVTRNKPKTFDQKHIEMVSEVDLDGDALRDIMDTHHKEYVSGAVWNNIGFKFDQFGSTKWFNEYIDRKYLVINSESVNSNSYYTANFLLSKINNVRNELLSAVVESEKKAEDQVNIAVGE
ncbi:hypothetical protein [Marinobacterium stanieri]|uniref:hypothetical protein n=1 Tax=Marinobacterium stanieri TaxID=49186 RepID=UPI003A8FDF8D